MSTLESQSQLGKYISKIDEIESHSQKKMPDTVFIEETRLGHTERLV